MKKGLGDQTCKPRIDCNVKLIAMKGSLSVTNIINKDSWSISYIYNLSPEKNSLHVVKYQATGDQT